MYDVNSLSRYAVIHCTYVFSHVLTAQNTDELLDSLQTTGTTLGHQGPPWNTRDHPGTTEAVPASSAG